MRDVAASWAEKNGADDADALASEAFVASLLSGSGDSFGALGAYQALVPLMEAALGARHYEVLLAKNELGALLGDVLQDWEARRPLAEEVAAGWAETLGAAHPHTLSARNNLAVTLENLREFEAAAVEYDAVLAGKAVQQGEAHRARDAQHKVAPRDPARRETLRHRGRRGAAMGVRGGRRGER